MTTMNAFAFKVIDAINREGIDNGQWGLVEDVENSVAYFGTEEEVELKGQWAYVYAEKDIFFSCINKIETTMILNIADSDNEELLLYRLDLE